MELERLTKLAIKQIIDMVNYSDIQEIISEEIEKRINTNIFIYGCLSNERIIFANNKREAIVKLFKVLPLSEKSNLIIKYSGSSYKNCIICGKIIYTAHLHYTLSEANEHYQSHDEDAIIDALNDKKSDIFRDVTYMM